MKKIVLIGDSIRMGYDKYVKEALEGVCEVFYPEENCKFAEYVLRFVHEWKKNGGWTWKPVQRLQPQNPPQENEERKSWNGKSTS